MIKTVTVKQRKASEVTDPALSESQLFLDIKDLGGVGRDGLQEGVPIDYDPETHENILQIKKKKKTVIQKYFYSTGGLRPNFLFYKFKIKEMNNLCWTHNKQT